MRQAGIAILMMTVAVCVRAQQPQTFEVASIKANKSGDGSVFINILPGGRFMVRNATLRELVQAAYQFEFQLFQIVGGDGWIDSDRFNIDAKSEGAFTQAQVSSMVQALLTDRFHLVLRKETRPMPIYALVVSRSAAGAPRRAAGNCIVAPIGRGAPASEADAAPRCGIHFDSGRDNGLKMTGVSVTMQQLAARVQFYVQRIVVDQTRLTGAFDFDLEFTPDRRRSGSPNGDDGLSIVTALQEQLGLRLNSQTGPVRVLVIDRAERPTEN